MFTRRENVAYIHLLEASDKDLFEIPLRPGSPGMCESC